MQDKIHGRRIEVNVGEHGGCRIGMYLLGCRARPTVMMALLLLMQPSYRCFKMTVVLHDFFHRFCALSLVVSAQLRTYFQRNSLSSGKNISEPVYSVGAILVGGQQMQSTDSQWMICVFLDVIVFVGDK